MKINLQNNKTELKFLWTKKFFNRFITAVCIIIPLLLNGCTGSNLPHQKTPLPVETIRLGLSPTPMQTLPIVAVEQGFLGEGLEVIITEYPSGKRTLEEGLLAGELDLAMTSTIPIVLNSFERQDFSIITVINRSDDQTKIIARKDAGIERPADLRGKRIATQEGSAVHFFLHIFLLKYGLSEQDVELSFKKAEDLPAALATGEIDAFSMREPFISQAQEVLGDQVVIFAEPGLQVVVTTLTASNNLIKDKPQVIDRVLRALVQAEVFIEDHPEQAMEIVANKLEIDRTTVAVLWPDLDPRPSLDQSLLLNLEDQARWAIASGLTDKTEVPNYLDFIYLKGLNAVKPEAVTIIH